MTTITLKVRGTARKGDIVASGPNWVEVNREVRRAYGPRAFVRAGNTVLGTGMREGMILRRVGRGDDYTVLEQLIIETEGGGT